MTIQNTRLLVGVATFGLILTVGAMSARAAGPFDGTWVLDIPVAAADTGRTNPTCPALRLDATITDSKITASLARVPSGTPNVVANGTGPGAAPLTGTVKADGTLTAHWLGYKASGKLNGDSGTVTVHGQCGPRIAMATRVKQ